VADAGEHALALAASLPLAAGTVAAATAASALLTWAWLGLARRRDIADAPGQRRLHATTTPRGGGVAIAVLVAAAAFGIALAQAAGPGLLPWGCIGAGLAAFAAVGLRDDVVPMSALAKFGGQWISAGVLVLGLLLAAPGEAGWIAFGLLLVAAVYVANIWNFMDGSNALVATQSLLVAAALATWPGQAADLRFLGLVLAGACLGFLPFNLPRARLFLGDVGSHVLGAGVFALGALSWRRGVVDLPVLGLLGLPMLLDSGLTLLRRAAAGRPVWRAHREHLYQYAVRSGHSHLAVCLAYGAATLALIGIARLSFGLRLSFVTLLSFILCSAFGLAVHGWLRRRWLSPGMRTRRHGAGHE
jgi:UDP-N-acetylmuramyl pentapeptide phosphotransferase/UDP-N-acetylglucosamine-1-phosphate transferase